MPHPQFPSPFPFPLRNPPELVVDHCHGITGRAHLARAGLLVERLWEYARPAVPPVGTSGRVEVAEPVLLAAGRRAGAYERQREPDRLCHLARLA